MAGNSLLVVDDDPEIGCLLAEVLGERYSVRVAGSAETALAMLARSPPDILITDCMLPGGGFHVLLGAAESAGVPVLLMSGHPDMMMRHAAGPYAFLAKPFKLNDLLETVADILGMREITAMGRS